MAIVLGALLAVALGPAAPLPAQTRVSKEAPPVRASGSVAHAALVARLDSLAVAFLAEAPAVGLTIGVVRGQDTLALRGYGFADRERRRPAAVGTVYRVGSITKQFTAAAILQLVDQGSLALDDPLTRFLPHYPQWRAVTIRQLLNHTSGVHSYTSVPTWAARMGDELPPDTVLGFVARDTFDFAPGTSFRYNNSGYVLLGLVLERVTGRPYGELLAERFFAPLGMRSATYCPTATTDTAYATGYDKLGQAVANARPISMSSPYAAGALCMSVPDFLAWQTALGAGRVLRPATYAAMTTPGTLADGKPMRYAFGLAPDTLAGRTMIQHGGDIPGGSAQQLWFPQDSLRVVVFTNTLGSTPDRLARNLARAVLGRPPVAPPRVPTAVPLAPERRALLLGTYDLRLPDGGTLTMTLTAASTGDGVIAQAAGQAAIPLIHAGSDTFGAAFDPTLRLTVVVEDGRAVRLVLRQGGGTLEGARRP